MRKKIGTCVTRITRPVQMSSVVTLVPRDFKNGQPTIFDIKVSTPDSQGHINSEIVRSFLSKELPHIPNSVRDTNDLGSSIAKDAVWLEDMNNDSYLDIVVNYNYKDTNGIMILFNRMNGHFSPVAPGLKK